MVAVPREADRDELELRAFKAAQIVEALSELEKTAGWKTLTEIFTAAKSGYYAGLTRRLMQGREIEQRKLDYNRGLFDGVSQLLEQPAKAEAAFKRALDRLEQAPPAEPKE